MMLNAAKCFAKLQSWVLPLRFLPLGPRSRPCPHTIASAWFETNSPKWHQSKPTYLKNMTWHRGYRISQRSQTQILLHLRICELVLKSTLKTSAFDADTHALVILHQRNLGQRLRACPKCWQDVGASSIHHLGSLAVDERIDVRCGPLSMALPPVALVHQGSHREVHLREHLGRW